MKTIECVFILYTVWTLLDYVNLFLIYDKFLTIERKPLKRGRFLWIAWMFLISYIYGLQSADIMYNKTIFWPLYLLYYMKIIPVLWSYFVARKKDFVLVLFYQLLVAMMSQGIVLFLESVFDGIFYGLFVFDLCEVFANVCITLFLSILLLARKNNILKIYFGDLSVFQYIVFCIVLFVAGLLEADVTMQYPNEVLLKVLSVGNVAMVCFMICQIILVRESETRKKKVIDVLDEQMKKVTDYYHAMTEQEEQTRKIRHDIKNLLFALHSMVEQGENDKALEYIEEMNGLCQRATKKYDTGNFIIDALLSAKATVGEKAGTELRCDGFIPSKGIENVDMVILLSNIVDNAVEACEKISGQKTIAIESVLQKQMWILSVKNPVKTDVKIQKNGIETTKKELHGYGIQNIQRVVKKYAGNLKFTCEEGIFAVRVMIQLKK